MLMASTHYINHIINIDTINNNIKNKTIDFETLNAFIKQISIYQYVKNRDNYYIIRDSIYKKHVYAVIYKHKEQYIYIIYNKICDNTNNNIFSNFFIWILIILSMPFLYILVIFLLSLALMFLSIIASLVLLFYIIYHDIYMQKNNFNYINQPQMIATLHENSYKCLYIKDWPQNTNINNINIIQYIKDYNNDFVII